MRTIALFLLFAGILVGPAHGDGLVYQLPKDGVAADFNMKMTTQRGDQKEEMTGTMRMASVGQVTIREMKCRWLEFVLKMKNGQREENIVAKLLIPEKHLGAGMRPMQHAVKGWIQTSPQRLKRVRNFQGDDVGPFAIFLSEPLADEVKLNAATVKTNIGKFECVVKKGKTYFKPDDDRKAFAATYINYHHPKAPFGVVKSSLTIDVIGTDDGQIEVTVSIHLTLQRIEKNVKSKLPNNK